MLPSFMASSNNLAARERSCGNARPGFYGLSEAHFALLLRTLVSNNP